MIPASDGGLWLVGSDPKIGLMHLSAQKSYKTLFLPKGENCAMSLVRVVYWNLEMEYC